jgi:catechol 2,3-dioxygenase-like lactoylglutathione lyase family enzyme
MDLYLVELTVADWPASVAWYRDRLGLTVELLDHAHQFGLLAAGPARLALKAGQPAPGSSKVTFRVTDLDAELTRLERAGVVPISSVRTSPEGYRAARLLDPDGHRVELFVWANPDAQSDHQTCYSDSLRLPAPRG